MKKLLFIALLISFGFQAKSQILIALIFGDKLNQDGVEFGLEGGYNLSTISGFETKSYIGNFNLGFYFDLRIKNQWSIYTGVLVKSNAGVNKLTENDLILLDPILYGIEGSYKQITNNFLVPVLAKYKFNNHIYIEAGPQFGLMYKSWIEFNSDIEGRDASIKEFNKDQLNRFDMGAMAGVGYRMMKGTGWTIGLKYYYGFIDVYKNIPNTKNSSIFIKMNFPIGVGDKKEMEKKKL
jgi:hypothetical protein